MECNKTASFTILRLDYRFIEKLKSLLSSLQKVNVEYNAIFFDFQESDISHYINSSSFPEYENLYFPPRIWVAKIFLKNSQIFMFAMRPKLRNKDCNDEPNLSPVDIDHATFSTAREK